MLKYFFLLALLPSLLIAQNTVSGRFSPPENYEFVLLYKSTPTGTAYIDKGELTNKGHFNIALDSAATAGIYKIVYGSPPQANNFDIIYNGNESIELHFDEQNGLNFLKSKENKLWASYQHSMEMVNQTISNYYTKNSTDKAAFGAIFKTLKETQNAFEEASEGMLVSDLITSSKPYIPVSYEDLPTYKNNLKHHYLEPVAFGNTLVQSSDFLMDRVMAFVFGMADDDNSEYKKQVDILVDNIGPGKKVIETILLETVWRNFKIMGHAKVANYITDTYLLDLSKQFRYNELTQDLLAYKNTSIGSRAVDFEIGFDNENNTTLHNLDVAQTYLLVFWSSTCSHCLKELPKVKRLVSELDDIKVIALGMEEEDANNWKQEISEYPNFIHVLAMGKWDNPIANFYGIEATPTYFLLNEKKEIINKPKDFEALKILLE